MTRRAGPRRPERAALVSLAAGLCWLGGGLIHGAHAQYASSWVELTVLRHDTLSGLAQQIFTRPQAWREVARQNRLANPDLIFPGQRLRVPADLLKTQAADAQVVAIVGEVRATTPTPIVADAQPAQSQAPSQALQAGDRLAEGAQLSVGARSSVVLELADGSRVQLLPDSVAALSTSRLAGRRVAAPAEPVSAAASTPWTAKQDGWFVGTMRLVQGSMEVLASKLRRAKPLEVETPTAVVGVRGTRYRVAVDDVSTRTEVLEGRVRAAPAGQPPGAKPVGTAGLDVASGYGARLAGEQRPAVEPLPAAPDLSSVPGRFERPVVRLDLPAAQTLRVQVARDAAFQQIVYDHTQAPGEPLRIAGLDDGQWFLRARQLSATHLGGRDAVRTFELKARPEPPVLEAPRPAGKLPQGTATFAWARSLEAASYRVQVARDAEFKDVVHEEAASGEQPVSLSLPEPGAYVWRVRSVRADGDQGPWGDAQPFSVRANPLPPQGRLAEDGSLVLSWGVPGEATGVRYEAEMARDPAFAEIVGRASLDQPQWRIPRANWGLPQAGGVAIEGPAYFRYRSIEPDGYVSPPCAPLRVDVPRDPRAPLLLLLPGLLAL